MSKKTKLGQGLIKALKSIIVEQENSDAQKKLDKLINASEKLGKAVAMRSRKDIIEANINLSNVLK